MHCIRDFFSGRPLPRGTLDKGSCLHFRARRRHPMVRYFVNEVAQPNGDHEVHQFGCYYLELARRKRDIGEHDTCVTAVATAKRYFPQANGCSYCSRPCHAD